MKLNKMLEEIIEKIPLKEALSFWVELGIRLHNFEMSLFGNSDMFDQNLRKLMYKITGDKKWLGENTEK